MLQVKRESDYSYARDLLNPDLIKRMDYVGLMMFLPLRSLMDT